MKMIRYRPKGGAKMTEKEKMRKGLWYDANYDQILLEEREKADNLCFEFNHTMPKYKKQKAAILNKLIRTLGEEVTILSPFQVDYGTHLSIGNYTFINHNAYFMDCAEISIGQHCFIGPNCGIYTANHPLNIMQRNQGLEKATPVKIEDNVWIGADVTILPGVTIGEGSVIGAKSLVTKDIPPHSLALGHPCKVIRKITNEDIINLQK